MTKTYFDHEKLIAYQRSIQVGLIKSIAPDRLGEEAVGYRVSTEI